MKKLKTVHSKITIIEAKPNEGNSELILYHNQLRNCAKKYNSENPDQVKISNLSEPFKEFKNYKKLYHKETWDELKDEYKRITEGDYFFQYRASFEITSFDQNLNQKDSEDFNWSFFNNYFERYSEAKNLQDIYYSVYEVSSCSERRLQREQIAFTLALRKSSNEILNLESTGDTYRDYSDIIDLVKTITDSEINDEISRLEKEKEEKERSIKKSWE